VFLRSRVPRDFRSDRYSNLDCYGEARRACNRRRSGRFDSAGYLEGSSTSRSRITDLIDLMCGRYVRRSDKQRIAEHFQVHGPSLPDFGPSWNVAPQTLQPIIRLNWDTGERELVLMRWGLIPFWAKDPSIGLTINAKVETITTAPAFREALKHSGLPCTERWLWPFI
jgi:hypothetical protein